MRSHKCEKRNLKKWVLKESASFDMSEDFFG